MKQTHTIFQYQYSHRRSLMFLYMYIHIPVYGNIWKSILYNTKVQICTYPHVQLSYCNTNDSNSDWMVADGLQPVTVKINTYMYVYTESYACHAFMMPWQRNCSPSSQITSQKSFCFTLTPLFCGGGLWATGGPKMLLSTMFNYGFEKMRFAWPPIFSILKHGCLKVVPC